MSPLQVWLGGLVKKSPKTQRELADEAGITEKHLSQMLTGKAEGSLSVWSRVLAAADQLHVTDPAPDELTALRADLVVQQKQNKELDAERDALRERIRALADAAELITEDPGMNGHPGYKALRALLGDA